MRILGAALVMAALAAFFVGPAAADPGSADPPRQRDSAARGFAEASAPCAYTFDEAMRRIIDNNEGAVAHEMTAEQVSVFAAVMHLPGIDRAAWLTSDSRPTVYVLVGALGCARGGGELPPERFAEMIGAPR